VALTDLKADSLEPTMAQVASSGAPAVATAGDVTRRADAERLIDETLKRFGRIDVLVNSAGVSARNAPPDWDWERVWDFVMAINMKGTFLMARGGRSRGAVTLLVASAAQGVHARRDCDKIAFEILIPTGMNHYAQYTHAPYTHQRSRVADHTRHF
jgi:NAD(P)-dependent dehydrogenase (short-subunit alcohol dehydrogenase family)